MNDKKPMKLTAMPTANMWRYLNGALSHQDLDRKSRNGRI